MENKLKTLTLAIMAGIAIGIGGVVYLSVENKMVGAMLFTIGLYTVCVQGLNLYTGKVGYMLGKGLDYIGFLAVVWFGNLIGTYCTAFAVNHTRAAKIAETAVALCQVKNGDSLISLFILGIFCGILMYAGVDSYKKCQNPLVLIFCVAVFILSGFEHCIADMFYYSLAGMWTLDVLVRILVITVGNAVGGILIPLLGQY